MKNIIYSTLLVIIAAITTSCNEGFGTWKSLNEQWFEEKKTTLGQGDTSIIATRVLPSGVMIEMYHTGYGPIPKPSLDPTTGVSSTIVATYKGYLVDGTKFNDAKEYAMSLSDAISGWQDALSIMPEGSSWRLYIPYSEGYSSTGSKTTNENFVVPPYSTLIFDIDLIKVYNF